MDGGWFDAWKRKTAPEEILISPLALSITLRYQFISCFILYPFILYCHGLPKVPDCQYAISKEWENWCHSKRNLLDYICLIGGFLRTVRCIVILSLSFFKVLEIYSIFEKGDYSKRWSSFLMQWLHPFRNLFGYLSSWDHSRSLNTRHWYRFNCRNHCRIDCFRFREPLLLAVQHRTFGGGTFDPRSPV